MNRFSALLNKLLLVLLFLFCNSLWSQNAKKLSQPEKDFEKFWNTFKDNYAFFQLKNIDWDKTYQTYRPLVSKKTKEKELLDIFEKMVIPLQDGHITLSKGENVLFRSKKTSFFKTEFQGIEKEFWKNTESTLIHYGFPKPTGIGPLFKEEPIYTFTKKDSISYIRISRCFANVASLFEDAKEKEDVTLMTNLFDSILIKTKNTKAIIIDLRANGGGHGGLELASRFVKSKTITHYKSVKVKGNYTTFTALEPQFIAPNSGQQYLQKIIILTNDKTASSAEDFTISLYRQDNVTTIGTNTSGMLSDMFSGELSNNINFTLSNQVYYTLEKEILEDMGVPVKVKIVNTKQDLIDKIDPVIAKALEIINSN